MGRCKNLNLKILPSLTNDVNWESELCPFGTSACILSHVIFYEEFLSSILSKEMMKPYYSPSDMT
jgi:hypothetical protein